MAHVRICGGDPGGPSPDHGGTVNPRCAPKGQRWKPSAYRRRRRLPGPIPTRRGPSRLQRKTRFQAKATLPRHPWAASDAASCDYRGDPQRTADTPRRPRPALPRVRPRHRQQREEERGGENVSVGLLASPRRGVECVRLRRLSRSRDALEQSHPGLDPALRGCFHGRSWPALAPGVDKGLGARSA